MKVTPVKKKFGKYAPGEVFEFPSKAAKIYIKLGKLKEAEYGDGLTQTVNEYQAKVMESEPIKEEVRISPLTGQPVRQYRNRKMESE